MTVKSCEKVEKSQVALTIEVNAAEFEAAVEKAYQKMRRKISVPGFRPGKAPRKMIERMYGAEVFFEEAINIAFPEAYEAAAEQEKLQIVGYPTVEMVGEVTKDGFTFKATTPVYPEVTLGEYKGLKAEKPGVKLRHQWIPLARMGNNIKRAVIASEDQKFLHHDGVDWDALELAMEKHIEKGKGGGGSTITQQVVKNVFLSHKKSYIRKGREILISLVLDYIWPKSRILEVYLNTAEFGEGIFGVEAASRYYFGCSASQLSRSQAAFLAAILPRPKYYQVHRNSAYIQRKASRIQAYMGDTPLRAAKESVVK